MSESAKVADEAEPPSCRGRPFSCCLIQDGSFGRCLRQTFFNLSVSPELRRTRMRMNAVSVSILLVCLYPALLPAQENPPPQGESPRQQENTQTTAPVPTSAGICSIRQPRSAQYHGAFNSPYSGENSLASYPERDVSLTTTLFFGFRAASQHASSISIRRWRAAAASARVTGLANASNGELPRVAGGNAEAVSCPALCAA